MKVYLIRHGESETNVRGMWTGWLDVALTEKGRADAVHARPYLEGVSFDKVYVSDLKRAVDTAELALPGCEYELTPLLREVNVGSIAAKPLDTLTAEDRRHIHELGYDIFGGETRVEFSQRVSEVISGLEGSGYENVALFTHAGWLRMMLDTVVGVNLDKSKILCRNCAIAVFDFDGGAWRLYSWINHT